MATYHIYSINSAILRIMELILSTVIYWLSYPQSVEQHRLIPIYFKYLLLEPRSVPGWKLSYDILWADFHFSAGSRYGPRNFPDSIHDTYLYYINIGTTNGSFSNGRNGARRGLCERNGLLTSWSRYDHKSFGRNARRAVGYAKENGLLTSWRMTTKASYLIYLFIFIFSVYTLCFISVFI